MSKRREPLSALTKGWFWKYCDKIFWQISSVQHCNALWQNIVRHIISAIFWQICSARYCDKILWDISSTQYRDEIFWQLTSARCRDEILWHISSSQHCNEMCIVTNIISAILWQIFTAQSYDKIFWQISSAQYRDEILWQMAVADYEPCTNSIYGPCGLWPFNLATREVAEWIYYIKLIDFDTKQHKYYKYKMLKKIKKCLRFVAARKVVEWI